MLYSYQCLSSAGMHSCTAQALKSVKLVPHRSHLYRINMFFILFCQVTAFPVRDPVFFGHTVCRVEK